MLVRCSHLRYAYVMEKMENLENNTNALEMQSRKDGRVSNLWLFLGMGVGAILGLAAYVQHWIS